MTTALKNALLDLTQGVNLASGLAHTNDMNRAKATFKNLHEHKEILLKSEIEAWALANKWRPNDADELGSLAQQIGEGKQVHITGAPLWNCDPYQRWASENQ